MSTVLQFADKTLDVDSHLLFELTKRCNYECLHCYTNASPRARTPEPSCEEIRRLVLSAHVLGFRAITLSGGELMLRRDIDEIIESLPGKIDVWLFTSGIHLGLERLLRWRPHVTGYTVSLDGLRERHNHLRQSPRSFDDITAFLKRVAALGLRLQMQCMVQRWEDDHLETVVEIAETCGAERVLFSHVSPDGRGFAFEESHMTARGLDALFSRVEALQKKTRVRLRTNLMPTGLVMDRFPRPAVHVPPSGEMLPWFGAPDRHALANLNAHGWDLKRATAISVLPSQIEQICARARVAAARWPGSTVPVDDLLVSEFRGFCECV
ncbi:MAG TPA: radical SAM protein [Bryobacteraceae bacterium]|nr:radical SAM protein [Bryobacteraceae bacterium]